MLITANGSSAPMPKTIHPDNIKQLCILRLSAIGDVCHAAAMVTRIRQQAPHIQITWIIGKIEYQLVKGVPGVEFIIFDKSLGREAFSTLHKALRGRRFDVLFLMQVAFRANLASLSIKAKYRIGFDWARSKEMHWLFANRRISPRQHSHVLDGFMGFADAIGIPAQPLSWDVSIEEADLKWAIEEAGKLKPFAAICPAASKKERNWMADRYAQVADHLKQKGFNVVLCGGPAAAERELADDILSSTDAISNDYVGKTSLKQLLALLAHASLVIAPDTGPAHMATVAGAPVIGLYAHSNPLRTGPYNNLQDVVSVYDEVIQEQQGKPWQSLPWGVRAKGKQLMERIAVLDVKSQIDKLLPAQTK